MTGLNANKLADCVKYALDLAYTGNFQFVDRNTFEMVLRQPLPEGAVLTAPYTLEKLIQRWAVDNGFSAELDTKSHIEQWIIRRIVPAE